MGLTQKLGSIPLAIQTDSSNNVGIGGAANASYKLAVTGTGNFTGALIGTTATFSGAMRSNGIEITNTTNADILDIFQSPSVLNSFIDYPSGRSLILRNKGSQGGLTLASTGAATFSSSVTTNGNGYHAINANITGSSYGTININSSGNRRVFMGFSESANTYGTFGVVDDLGVERGIQITRATGAATFSSSVTAASLTLSNTDGYLGTINSTGANGGYFEWRTSGTTIADIGTSQQIFGTGGNDTFGINGRGARSLVFGTNNTERMRITSVGNVRINSTADINSRGVLFQVSGPETAQLYGYGNGYGIGLFMCPNSAATGTHTAIAFRSPANGDAGSITTTSSSTNYNTSSDYRLKEDLKEFNGLSLITNIKVYDFKWKTDESRSYGVIAHELAEVVDYAVIGSKDDKTEDNEIKAQGVDYSKLVPILIKAIQEQNEIITKQGEAIEELKALINK